MNKFIWQNWKPRLPLPTINRRLTLGGLGLPNLQVYHIAVTLDQIRYWWHNSKDKQWVHLESAMAGISDWRAALLDPLRDLPPRRILSPPVITTLRYWKFLLIGDPSLSGLS